MGTRLALLYDTQTVLGRHLLKMAGNRTLLVTNLMTPLVFLIFISQLFQKLTSFPGASTNYVAYLMPGIVVLAGFLNGAQSGVSIVNDLNSGFLQKLMLTPVSRASILLGRLAADVLIVEAESVIVILAAMLKGATVATGFPGVLLILLTTGFFGLAWSGFFLAIGMKVRKPETLSAIASFLSFLLLFVSTLMLPKSFLPSWAQTISDFNPMSYASDVGRYLVLGGLTRDSFVSAYLVIGSLAVVTLSAALYQFRKVVS